MDCSGAIFIPFRRKQKDIDSIAPAERREMKSPYLILEQR